MLKNVAIWLTLSRIVTIPVVIATFYMENSVIARQIAAILFLYASITDFLDGYIARNWNMQSKLGRFLDPIADKLLVSAIIIMLVKFSRIDVIPALAIICREILVSGLREFLAELNISMPVTKLAKIKTSVQMVAILLLLLGSKGSNIEIIDYVASFAIWIAAILTIITGYIYLEASLKNIKTK